MSFPTVAAAIEAFDDWTAPWAFYEAVAAHDAMSNADRDTWQVVWAEACLEPHWREGLHKGLNAAGQALAMQFPWLGANACAKIVRAASYQWR